MTAMMKRNQTLKMPSMTGLNSGEVPSRPGFSRNVAVKMRSQR